MMTFAQISEWLLAHGLVGYLNTLNTVVIEEQISIRNAAQNMPDIMDPELRDPLKAYNRAIQFFEEVINNHLDDGDDPFPFTAEGLLLDLPRTVAIAVAEVIKRRTK